jgi:three-Cys-motif partner protein
MTDAQPPCKFDEIGNWSELKLEIVEKYGAAYTNAFRNATSLKKYYIDAFSGAGVHVSKRTKEQIEGSPARALKVSPPFDGFYFIDLDEDKTTHLKKLCEGRGDVHIHTGDASAYLTKELLPTIQFRKFNRARLQWVKNGLPLNDLHVCSRQLRTWAKE